MKLYPSILTSSMTVLEEQLAWCRASQVVEVVQIDILDGYFADNVTVSPLDLTQLEFGDLQLDFHLMVEEPMDFVNEIIGIGEYLPIRAIIAQVERMSYQPEYLRAVRNHHWKVGLSLDLFTPVDGIESETWPDLDIVQLMSIEAGFQGQEFNAQALDKIAHIHQQAQPEVEIIVDGGIEAAHVPLLQRAGVGGVAVGSALWTATDPQARLEEFAELMQTEE